MSSNSLGMTITRYARSRRISTWKSGLHRALPAFPKPVGVGGGVRRIRYYDEQALDDYFKAIEGLEPTRGEIVRPVTIMHKFVTTKWLDGECRVGELAEDD